MPKLTLNTITGAYASTTELNVNFALIEAAIEKCLFLDGTSPNAMSADLDMNGYDILNVTAVTLAPVVDTTTNLADVTASINTTSAKTAGYMVFNTTTSIPVWALGADDDSLWVDATGATAHTPV